ncbi:MAG TPA: endonuclease domain-containing protein [Caulobacterales bacterium]|nr:endonuclease domain-containing protein [Caulobacterales bacterium]
MRPTPSRGEKAAWKQLRTLKDEGFSFRREHTIGPFRADFVCLRRRVIVEVDGGVHALAGRAGHDGKRDAWLAAEGFRVLRFKDSVILSEANWLENVRDVLKAQPDAPYRWKTSATLPLEGGGQGGGEGEELDAGDAWLHGTLDGEYADLTPPPAPSPSRGGE